MNDGWQQALSLIIVGAGPRLIVAGAVVGLLWAGFFWATTPVTP